MYGTCTKSAAESARKNHGSLQFVSHRDGKEGKYLIKIWIRTTVAAGGGGAQFLIL